jgi:hypothetical protein
MKTALKLKINPIRLYLGLIFYPIKPSTGLFFLIKSRETILLRKPRLFMLVVIISVGEKG